MTPPGARKNLWWTDGTHVRELTPEQIQAWLARGVAYGWVVYARDAVRALLQGRAVKKLDGRTKCT